MTVHIKVTGLVQGVFFRKSTKLEAERLGLVGWVRNLKDKSVEIMATGGKSPLEDFCNWCKKGPPLSKVEVIEVDWLPVEEEFEGFAII